MTHLPKDPEQADDGTVYTFDSFGPAGLLWLVNRVCFNPWGLALAFHADAESGATVGWELTAAAEPYRYDENIDNEAFQRAMSTVSAARMRLIGPAALGPGELFTLNRIEPDGEGETAAEPTSLDEHRQRNAAEPRPR